jgi:hypothetical protein
MDASELFDLLIAKYLHLFKQQTNFAHLPFDRLMDPSHSYNMFDDSISQN